jgi:hypothetical protein
MSRGVLLLLLLQLSSSFATPRRLTDERSAKFFATVPNFQVASVRKHNNAPFHTRLLQESSSVQEHEPNTAFSIDGFNRTFVLELSRNDKLFHPDYKTVNVGKDGTETSSDTPENCYYIGKVKDKEHSVVTADTCADREKDGLHAIIHDHDDVYHVLPYWSHFEMDKHATVGATVPHIMYRLSDRKGVTTASAFARARQLTASYADPAVPSVPSVEVRSPLSRLLFLTR